MGISRSTTVRISGGRVHVPAKGNLVDLAQSQAPAQIGVGNMRVVVVEVVEGGVTAIRALGWRQRRFGEKIHSGGGEEEGKAEAEGGGGRGLKVKMRSIERGEEEERERRGRKDEADAEGRGSGGIAG